MNPHKSYLAVLESLGDTRPRVALHSCCAVCSSAVLTRLAEHFDVTVVFYNPNIFPAAEYEKRKAEQIRLISLLQTEANPIGYVDFDYDYGEFLACAKGLESEPEGGARCTECFRLRLEKTARYAKENGFDWFCSTLTVSPHKDAPRINAVGLALQEELGVRWLPSDFKKQDGYLLSCRLAAAHELYRQNYCGCGFALALQEARQ